MKIQALFLILIMISLLTGCDATDPITDGVYFDELYSESFEATSIESTNIQLGGAPLLIPAYGEIYQTAFETVECHVADTYYIVDGPTTAGEILGFTNNGLGRLTYDDVTEDRICLITTAVAVSVPVDDRPAIISSKIFLNGVADDASFIGEYISDADPADALPIMCLMTLQPNDYIEIYVASGTANTTVVINSMTLVATTVD